MMRENGIWSRLFGARQKKIKDAVENEPPSREMDWYKKTYGKSVPRERKPH
jgi:hypothetical protein